MEAVHFVIPFQGWVVHLSASPFVPESTERVADVPVSPRGTEQHLVTANCFSFIVELKLLSSLDFSPLYTLFQHTLQTI